MGSPRPLTLKPPMVRPESQQRGFLRNLFQSLSNLGCRHLHQSVASRKISAATYEMFVMCASCKKRLSPGVVLGKGSQLRRREAFRSSARTSRDAINGPLSDR